MNNPGVTVIVKNRDNITLHMPKSSTYHDVLNLLIESNVATSTNKLLAVICPGTDMYKEMNYEEHVDSCILMLY